MSKKIVSISFFICCCVLCNAQQVVSSGGYAVKSEVSVNWILGGNLSDIPTYDLGAISQAYQEQFMESEISLKVYPLPASDFFNIEIIPAETNQLILELFDNSGVKILNKVVVIQNILQISISDIPCGIYFLKVFLNGNDLPIKVEKIVKIQTNAL